MTCNPCSAPKESECRLKPLDPETKRGYRRQSCSKTQDEQCVLCDPIEKSIFSDNEEFVVDEGYECQTTCTDGFYRDLNEPYYCRPCTDLATLQAEVAVIREDNTFYRFHGCTKFANARYEPCELVCDVCNPTNEYETSPCTTSQNRVCDPCTQCNAGEYQTRPCSQFKNAECQPCGTCGAGKTVLEACSESTDITCQPCPSETFKIAPGNEECTSCQSPCVEGTVEVFPCTSTRDRECQTCSFCSAGKFRDESGCVDAVCTDCPTGKFMASTEHTNTECDECNECGENSYVSAQCTNTTQTSCDSCPTNSGSPADSQEITACQCRPGYTGSDGGACDACADGKFKSAIGSASCTDCTAIRCEANFYQHGCRLDSDGCIDCPDGTESPAGSTSIEDCLCSLGTEKRSSQAEGESHCVECATGKYRENLSDMACTQCADAHATTISPGSASASDCVCDRGYLGPGSSCSACIVGRYKDVTGANPCSVCQNYATSPTASTSWNDCTCLSGYQRYGDFFSPSLPAGNDFNASRDQCCVVCEAGKYLDACTESYAGDCVPCGEGRTTENPGAYGEELCVCSAGYSHTAPDSVECVKCLPGTYNPHLGVQTCSNCDAGKYGEHEGADEPEDCTVCPLNHYCTEGAGSPENCPSTHPYSWTGSTSLSDCCQDCQLGEHYTDLAMNCDCSLCPDGKEAPTRPAHDSAACQDCGAGKFRSMAFQGSSGCESCQAGKFSTASGAISESTCQSCPANSVSLAGSSVITACECEKGYTGPDGGTCQACAQGKFKGSTGSQHCFNCIANCQCLSGQSHCVCDNSRFFSPEASSHSSHCECAAGFSYEETIHHPPSFFSCISCEEGKSKNAPSKTGCITCSEGKYSDARGALTCTDCGEGLTSPAGSTSSSDCRIKTFEYTRGLGDSRMCYTDQIWPSTTSNYALGRDAYYDAPTLASCWNSCVNTFGEDINHIFWDWETHNCKCQIDCKCLVTGQYNTSTSTYIVSKDRPLPETCQCSPGTTGPDGSNPDSSYSECTECPAGTYKASVGSAVCDSCNENQSAPAGSTDISACGCQLGYEFFTPPCDGVTGNPFFFSPVDCPEGYCSPCPLGHHKNITGNSSCVACPAGNISDTTGSIDCTSCPENSQVIMDPEFGATSCDNPCGPGYEGPDDQCTACNAGSFKDGYGSGPCTQCPAGKFSSASGSVDCTSCAANSASADGATQCTACTRGQTFKVASVDTTYTVSHFRLNVGDVFRKSSEYMFAGDDTYTQLSTHHNLRITNSRLMWWLHPSTDDAVFGAFCANRQTNVQLDDWLSWTCMTLLDSCKEQIIF